MTNRYDPTDTEPHDKPGSVRVGRETLSEVFRSDGGSELSSHHNTRLPRTDNDSASGPRLRHEITDGDGPADIRKIDASLPGPSLLHEMTDSEGPSELRHMQDAQGPVVPRKAFEDHYYRQQKPDLSATPLQSAGKADSSREALTQEPPTIQLDTYSIQMEDRLAKVKASQKETLDKMKLLQADAAQTDDSVRRPRASTTERPLSLLDNIPDQRHLLTPSRIHQSVRSVVAIHHRDTVDEVLQAIATHRVVVIGMGGNPFVFRARTLLRQQGIEHYYLGYGNYLQGWRRRNALKMWSGWPTFPMVFIHGVLIGGYQDLQTLIASGELHALLQD